MRFALLALFATSCSYHATFGDCLVSCQSGTCPAAAQTQEGYFAAPACNIITPTTGATGGPNPAFIVEVTGTEQ